MAEVLAESQHSLRSLLCNEKRDFFIKNNGKKVKVEDLEGKIVGLYFGDPKLYSWIAFTHELAEVYAKLLGKGGFEIIYVSPMDLTGIDGPKAKFQMLLKKMPWLALPLSDTETRKKFDEMFGINGSHTLVLLDKDGKVISHDGVKIIEKYGDRAYPFTKERLEELPAEEEALRQTQNLNSLLVSPNRDFVIANGGKQVPVSELVGKTVCLYFSFQSTACTHFTPQLVQFYNELKKRGEELEIIFVSCDQDEDSLEEYMPLSDLPFEFQGGTVQVVKGVAVNEMEEGTGNEMIVNDVFETHNFVSRGDFERCFGSMPWLALPFGDPLVKKLSSYFGINVAFPIPTLIVLGPDGKTLQTEGVDMVKEYGARVYPFTVEKLDELKAEEARRAEQTIESLLVSDERDFVIKHDGGKVPVSELKGKTVGLYFADHCSAFTPLLVKLYVTQKEKGEAFEIVFLSDDNGRAAFEECYASMPWLALPFGDKTEQDLHRYFHVKGIPSLVIIGPDGKTVTTDGINIITNRVVAMQQEMEELAERWSKDGNHGIHEHPLALTQRQSYTCDRCEKIGSGWSFYCKECDFDLHPDCAFNDELSDKNEKRQQESEDYKVLAESQHGLRSLLCNEKRDFLIKNNGEKVKVEDLDAKIVGLYFGNPQFTSWIAFTNELAEVYTKLLGKAGFEIIYVCPEDYTGIGGRETAFQVLLKEMPWLALPLSDTETRKKFDEMFCINGSPTLVLLDKDGKVISDDGVRLIEQYGEKAYPFTREREEALRQTQSLNSLLVSPDRDFLTANGGKRVPASELVGKTVCLYFADEWRYPSKRFTPKLVQFYSELKKRGEKLEIVFVYNDELSYDVKIGNVESFQTCFGSMPWLALPFKDPLVKRLKGYFKTKGLQPDLIVLGPDGKTLQTEGVEMVSEYGSRVYPFTAEKLDELKAEDKARRAAQTIESLLVSDERDFVIKHDGGKVPVSDLKGKTVGLFFADQRTPPCKEFTRMLVKVYDILKEEGEAFEIVFLSSDKDQEVFEEYYASMPWLALPFGDKTKKDLKRYFHVKGIPYLVIIGPDGKTMRTDGINIISTHGAKGYPFTDARLVEMQQEMEEVAERWPEEVNHSIHDHPLALTQRQSYICDGCEIPGSGWSFCCKECNFDLHPDCAFNDEYSDKNENGQQESEDYGIAVSAFVYM